MFFKGFKFLRAVHPVCSHTSSFYSLTPVPASACWLPLPAATGSYQPLFSCPSNRLIPLNNLNISSHASWISTSLVPSAMHIGVTVGRADPAAWPAALRRGEEGGIQGLLPLEHSLLLPLRCLGRGAWLRILASVQTPSLCGLV